MQTTTPTHHAHQGSRAPPPAALQLEQDGQPAPDLDKTGLGARADEAAASVAACARAVSSDLHHQTVTVPSGH